MGYETNLFDEQVVSILKGGGVGFLPTDTIYGLSCLALDEVAVSRIYQLKKRDQGKPMVILIANTSQAESLGISAADLEPVLSLWPALLTVIFPAKQAPAFLRRGARSLALRMPDNDALLKLLAQTGPLVSTSANLEGEKPLTTAHQAKELFGGKLDFYIDKGTLSGQPSTLAKFKDGRLEVIRLGAFNLE